MEIHLPERNEKGIDLQCNGTQQKPLATGGRQNEWVRSVESLNPITENLAVPATP